MDEQLKKQIKEYLSENLTLDFEITPDMYGIHPDQIVLKLKLEDTVINSITMYDITDY
jgi:hypothetical protein